MAARKRSRVKTQVVETKSDATSGPYPDSGRVRSSEAGRKDDAEKPRFELVCPYSHELLAKVLTAGAKKYEPHNWRKGLEYSRIIGAIERHVAAIKRGEDLDNGEGGTGLHHIGCVLAEAMFLASFQLTGRTELDDRPKIQKGWEAPYSITINVADFAWGTRK